MSRKVKIVRYKDKHNLHRARIVAKNGKIMFETSESYDRVGGLNNAIDALIDAIRTDQFVTTDLEYKKAP